MDNVVYSGYPYGERNIWTVGFPFQMLVWCLKREFFIFTKNSQKYLKEVLTIHPFGYNIYTV
jgi:hypothetical protein